eukprot:353707-Chlamydomonas_euryale.AAC.2
MDCRKSKKHLPECMAGAPHLRHGLAMTCSCRPEDHPQRVSRTKRLLPTRRPSAKSLSYKEALAD